MISLLGKKQTLFIAIIMTFVMFLVVMFVANPLIDGDDGMGVLALQLAFDKEIGTQIIDNWTKTGRQNFNKLIFTDYIYALSYSIFFASWLCMLIIKKGKENLIFYKLLLFLPFLAGIFDWIENTLELFFINNPTEFSNILFFLNSTNSKKLKEDHLYIPKIWRLCCKSGWHKL